MVQARCPRCSSPIEPGDTFCAGCGTALHGSAATFSVNIGKDRTFEVDRYGLHMRRGGEEVLSLPWDSVGEVGTRMVGPGLEMMRFSRSPMPRGAMLLYASFYATSRDPRQKTIAFDQREVEPTDAQRREIESLFPGRPGMDPPYTYLLIRLTLNRIVEIGRGLGRFEVMDRLASEEKNK